MNYEEDFEYFSNLMASISEESLKSIIPELKTERMGGLRRLFIQFGIQLVNPIPENVPRIINPSSTYGDRVKGLQSAFVDPNRCKSLFKFLEELESNKNWVPYPDYINGSSSVCFLLELITISISPKRQKIARDRIHKGIVFGLAGVNNFDFEVDPIIPGLPILLWDWLVYEST